MSLSWVLVLLAAAETSGFHALRGRRGMKMAMAARKTPHEANVEGSFFVDHTCIDCDTCRWMAPKTFGRTTRGGQSYVYQQPETEDDRTTALQAMVSCPTGSIRSHKPDPLMKDVVGAFPLAIDERIPQVFHLGYHSEKSFGATSYFVASKADGGKPFNVMFDSPRFSSKLAKALEAAGGVHLMLLSHKDDVSDHNKWKERFPDMVRVMHKADVRGTDRWPYIDMTGVEMQLDGSGPWELDHGVRVLHTPGHSQGCITAILPPSLTGGDGVAFTGDHLALNARLGRIDGFARYGNDSQQQADSMDLLVEEDILWVLPGHGRRFHFDSAEERMEALRDAAEEYRRDPMGSKTSNEPLFHVEPVAA